MSIDVYVETGSKRVFAAAIDWPGWCRAARDEAAALDALAEYAGRYRKVLARGVSGFPKERSFRVVERLRGDSATDFGAPGAIPRADRGSFDDAELQRATKLLRACWTAFDAAAEGARGRTLRKGPRGGGRDVPKMRAHVLEAEQAYLRQLGGSPPPAARDLDTGLAEVRNAFIEALEGRLAGDIAPKGPRGGARWPPRYAVRRAAWHVLDHAWEIEDRVS